MISIHLLYLLCIILIFSLSRIFLTLYYILFFFLINFFFLTLQSVLSTCYFLYDIPLATDVYVLLGKSFLRHLNSTKNVLFLPLLFFFENHFHGLSEVNTNSTVSFYSKEHTLHLSSSTPPFTVLDNTLITFTSAHLTSFVHLSLSCEVRRPRRLHTLLHTSGGHGL